MNCLQVLTMKTKLGYSLVFALSFGFFGIEASEEVQNVNHQKLALSPLEVVKPELRWDNVFYILADYLLWQPHEDGLGFANKFSTSTNHATISNLDFHYDSGFRVGLAYRMPYDKWELFTTWTWFYGKAKGSSNAAGEIEKLYPEWDESIVSNPPSQTITEMEGKWRVHLNTLDGEIGRYFRVTRAIAFRPHYGVRGAWIKQTYTVTQLGGRTSNEETLLVDEITLNNYFKGVGPRAAIDTEWQICNHFSFYGNAGCSLLYGTFHLGQREIITRTNYVAPYVAWDVHDKINQVVSTGDLGLGLRYDDTFLDGVIGLRLQAGWEFNDYFQQNKFKHLNLSALSQISYESYHEDLTTQGFVFSAEVQF